MKTSKHFFIEKENEWQEVEKGIKRQISPYDKSIMMVKVVFEQGAVGALHTHPHVQTTYVASGRFEVTISGEKQILQTGDCFFAPSDKEHGVVCLEKGMLIDVFSPMREDFL